MERRLTTILAADLVGYSRLMAADEEGVIQRLRSVRKDVVDPEIARTAGRIVKTTGDGLLVEFPSPVSAVRCALAVQLEMTERETGPEDQRLTFRVGVNLGDVVEDGDDILGDGVNVAARLEALAPPGGICISRAVHDQLRGKVDAPLTRLGPQMVKNIPEPIEVWRVETGDAPQKFEEPRHALPEKPSIVVLPFANMSAEPDQDFFCDGMSEDITTALSHFSELFVIARNTAFTYKDRSVNVRDISSELGVQFVLEGSVRRSGPRIRINAQLVDAINDRHVWAAKYDRKIDDIFDVQDEITEAIVMAVAPEIRAAEIARVRRESVPDLGSWEIVIRALGEMDDFSAAGHARAYDLLKTALDRDGNSVEALAVLSACHALEALYAWNRPPPEALQLSAQAASKASMLDPRNDVALVCLGVANFVGRKHHEAVGYLRSGMEVNPNSSSCIGMLGVVLVWLREFEEATELLNRAVRLSPRDHWTSHFVGHLGVIETLKGRHAEALVKAEEALRHNPRNPSILRLLASAQGHLGLEEQAKVTLARIYELMPGVSLSQTKMTVPIAFEEDMEIFLEGLRKAGMPE